MKTFTPSLKTQKTSIIPYVNKTVVLDSIEDNIDGKYLKFVFNNVGLVSLHNLLEGAYKLLISNLRYRAFGNKKILIAYVSGYNKHDDSEYSEAITYTLHVNHFVSNDTSWRDYYRKIKHEVKPKYNVGYGFDTPNTLTFKVWTLALINHDIVLRTINRNRFRKAQGHKLFTRNYATSSRGKLDLFDGLNNIKPLKREANKITDFSVMDIETVNVKGFQQPFIISFKNNDLLETFINDSVDDLWFNFFQFIFNNLKSKTNIIFIHNLGGFDGIFLHKYISSIDLENETIVDESGKYILIKVKFYDKTYIFKDSYRVLPVSLDDLCKVFNCEGKLSKYDVSWNNFNINSPNLINLIEYAKQDVLALYQSLKNAQLQFINDYKVDLATVVSLPSLALKIFRLKYLQTTIPILTDLNDKYVRNSYFGGSVDYYEAIAENCYYYDVNSLYPYAMCELMPTKLLRSVYEVDDKFNLDSFFGFLHVDIECPLSVERPVLPYRLKDKTIFPHGKFSGYYFSEELKAVTKIGYKILKIHSFKEFKGEYIFKDYVYEMYSKKANTTGAARWISKMLLNSLYGIFGRKQELINTINIKTSDLHLYVNSHVIINIINLGERSILLVRNNLSKEILKQLNINMDDHKVDSNFKIVKSNVGIASAITSYARIKMLPLKIDLNTIYTDTDSAITKKPINNSLIGKGLGQFKDELGGLTIDKILIFGPKQYGYIYKNKDGCIIQKSVWAGISRNSLTFDELLSLFKGEIITKNIKNRFYRSFLNLTIKIKDVNISIKHTPDKLLIDNKYQPIVVNDLYNPPLDNPELLKLQKLINKFKYNLY